MGTMAQSRFGLLVMVAAVSMGVAACSKPPIVCGGGVSPKNATDADLRLVSIARAESVDLCNQRDSACDFDVYKTRGGRTVRATRVIALDGRCVTRIGDDRFYAFDESGRLKNVINGL